MSAASPAADAVLTVAPLRRHARDPYFVAGIAIYLLFILIAVFADTIAPNAPKDILFLPDGRLAAALPPGALFLLGTTTSGCDIFSQLVHGAQSALIVGTSAAFVVVTVGTAVGLVAGYFGGWADAVLMRIADVALGVPLLPFVIVLAAFLGPNTWNVVLAMSLLLWPNSARIIRAQVLSLRERAYIEAARTAGSGHLRILTQHIAPNILPLALLFGSIAIGWAILTEAAVSFLGFADPDTTTWGFMLQDAYVSQALSRGLFNWFVPPGICIVLLVSAGFFISRSYEQFLFPRLRD
jgi:peptide/nickel transport system permease protein